MINLLDGQGGEMDGYSGVFIISFCLVLTAINGYFKELLPYEAKKCTVVVRVDSSISNTKSRITNDYGYAAILV